MIPGVTRAPAIVLFAFFGTVGCAQGETSAPADVAACPYVIENSLPRSSDDGAAKHDVIRRYIERSSSFASPGGTKVKPPDESGCLPLHPPDPPQVRPP